MANRGEKEQEESGSQARSPDQGDPPKTLLAGEQKGRKGTKQKEKENAATPETTPTSGHT